MRTHLLQTTYLPPAEADIENDTGSACNDELFAASDCAEAIKVRLSVVAPTAPSVEQNDDYYLAGYAGI